MDFDFTILASKDLLRYVRWKVERREPSAAPEPIPTYEDTFSDDVPGGDHDP